MIRQPLFSLLLNLAPGKPLDAFCTSLWTLSTLTPVSVSLLVSRSMIARLRVSSAFIRNLYASLLGLFPGSCSASTVSYTFLPEYIIQELQRTSACVRAPISRPVTRSTNFLSIWCLLGGSSESLSLSDSDESESSDESLSELDERWLLFFLLRFFFDSPLRRFASGSTVVAAAAVLALELCIRLAVPCNSFIFAIISISLILFFSSVMTCCCCCSIAVGVDDAAAAFPIVPVFMNVLLLSGAVTPG